jgi:hypothetical protein
MQNLRVGAGVAVAAFISLAQSARADFISIQSLNAQSTEGLGSFTGSMSYTPDPGNPALARLVISLTNTTAPASRGGFITGFAFNFDSSDPAATLTMESATYPFEEISDVSAPPFGTFDHGAALRGKWTGGGSPNPGIPIGASGIFTFDVAASDARTLSANDFIAAGEGIHGRSSFGLAVRFRGFNNGGSDKVPGGAVPAPGTLALIGLGGFLAFRRAR